MSLRILKEQALAAMSRHLSLSHNYLARRETCFEPLGFFEQSSWFGRAHWLSGHGPNLAQNSESVGRRVWTLPERPTRLTFRVLSLVKESF